MKKVDLVNIGIAVILSCALMIGETNAKELITSHKEEKQLKTKIEQTVDTYLSTSVNDPVFYATGDNHVTTGTISGLTKEQKDEIIASVTANLKEIYGEAKDVTLSEQYVAELEAKITKSVMEKMADFTFTDEQKQQLTLALTTILESGLTDQLDSLGKNTTELQQSVTENVTTINQQLVDATDRISVLEKELTTLSSKASQTDVTNISSSLETTIANYNTLKESYEDTVAELQNTINSLDGLSSSTGADKTALKEQITNVVNQMNSMDAQLYNELERLASQLGDSDTELSKTIEEMMNQIKENPSSAGTGTTTNTGTENSSGNTTGNATVANEDVAKAQEQYNNALQDLETTSGTLKKSVEEVTQLYAESLNMMSDKYNAAKTYAYGDFCIYNNVLYRNIALAGSTGILPTGTDASSSYWAATTIGKEIPTFRLDGDKLYITTTDSVIK